MNNIRTGVAGGKDIFSTDFSEYLPEALKKDPKIYAASESLTKELLSVSAEIKKVMIYARIDELPEDILDILAYDLHVDWYDYGYSLQVKRNILKSSVRTHKTIGTKRAVEELIQDVFGEGTVKEWFEYGDDPFYFKIETSAEATEGINDFFAKLIKNVKNARSHLRSVDIKRKMEQKLLAGIGQRTWTKNPAVYDGGILDEIGNNHF